MANIDSLDIEIRANAFKAINAIDTLTGKLNRLNTQLASLSGVRLKSLASGVESLSQAMVGMKAVSGADFTRLKDNIEKLGRTNVGNLDRVASGLRQITNAFSKLSGTSSQATSIASLVNAISKFGNKGVANAIGNIPLLAVELKNLMTTLSTAPVVSRNVIDMTNAIANLASQGSRVGTSARSMVSGFTSFGNSVSSARRKTFSLAAAFGKFYASYFLVLRGIKGMAKAITTSMDYVETYNYFAVTMNKIGREFGNKFQEYGYESAEAYADSFQTRLNALTEKMTGYKIGDNGELLANGLTNLGADPKVLMNFQAKLGAVTNSIGLAGEASLVTQKAFSMLAYDMSSLTNIKVEDVMQNLTSGLVGQSRSLYRYGVDITSATLKTIALENGITKSVSAMTQSEKMQLRLLAILKQTENSWGDMANTLGSAANQYRLFSQGISNLVRILGSLFLPIVQKALPIINGFIYALQDLFTSLGQTFYGESWLTGIMDGISSGAGDLSGLEEALDDVGDTLDADTSSAKKLKQQLQGFDELNVISTKDNSDSDAFGNTFDLTPQLTDALGKYEKVWNKAFADMKNNALSYAEKFKKLFEPVTEFFKLIKDGDFEGAGKLLSELRINLTNWLDEKIKEINWRKIGENIGDFLRGMDWLGIIKSGFKLSFDIAKAIADVWLGSFEVAPFETMLISAFALFRFTGLSTLIATKIGDAILLGLKQIPAILFGDAVITGGLGTILTTDVGALLGSGSFAVIGTTIATALIGSISAAIIGFNFGKMLGSLLFPNDDDIYYQFKWFGEGGFFQGVFGGYDSMSDWWNIQKGALTEMFHDFDSAFKKLFKPITDFGEKLKTNMVYVRNYAISELNNMIASYESFANNILQNMMPLVSILVALGNVSGLSIPTRISIPRIPHFMDGGFIGSASVFTAGENGIPELLGTVGGRSAVASGEEITGIRDAVYETGDTQANLLSTAVGLLQIIAEKEFGVSDDYIFSSYNNSAKAFKSRTGLSPI